MNAHTLLTPGLEIDGRIGVTIRDYALSSLNGKVNAYLYNPDKAAFGLDAWRTIKLVDPPSSPRSESHTMIGDDDWSKDVGPRYVIYLLPEDAARVAGEKEHRDGCPLCAMGLPGHMEGGQ